MFNVRHSGVLLLSGVLIPMTVDDPTTIVAAVLSVPHFFAAIPMDDNTVSVLAMLIGITGGWMLTGLLQQMKAKRVKVAAEARKRFRKE
jgi:hypothetical protein